MEKRKHIHSTLSMEQFKEVKKVVIDLNIEMQEFIRLAVLEKCEKEIVKEHEKCE